MSELVAGRWYVPVTGPSIKRVRDEGSCTNASIIIEVSLNND